MKKIWIVEHGNTDMDQDILISAFDTQSAALDRAKTLADNVRDEASWEDETFSVHVVADEDGSFQYEVRSDGEDFANDWWVVRDIPLESNIQE